MKQNPTVGDIFQNFIIIPSRANDLLKYECDIMFPERIEIPLYPKGIYYSDDDRYFRVQKSLKGKSYNLGIYRTFLPALKALTDFCDKHKIKV